MPRAKINISGKSVDFCKHCWNNLDESCLHELNTVEVDVTWDRPTGQPHPPYDSLVVIQCHQCNRLLGNSDN